MNKLEEYFNKLRFNKKFHLGLGDIRLTIGMQEDIIEFENKLKSIIKNLYHDEWLILTGEDLNDDKLEIDLKEIFKNNNIKEFYI